MKDKQKRKKERTWAEAARMVLENFSDAPMTPKQILHVIQTKGLKEMRSGTAPLACLVTMLHSQVRGDRVKNSIFFKLPGRMSLFTLKKNALQWTKNPSGSEASDPNATPAASSTASFGAAEGAEQESGDSTETTAASASVDETSSSASCSTEPQTRLSRSSQSGRQRKKSVMMPRVVLTPLKVNGEHVSSGAAGRRREGSRGGPGPTLRARSELGWKRPQHFKSMRGLRSGPMKRNRGGVEVDFETPGSILVNTNIRALINTRTFAAFPPHSQQQLLQLLPEVDRQVGPDGLARLSSSALNNEFFTHASQSWKERLAEGEFTHEMQVRFRQEMEKEKKVEAWKEKFFEEYHGQKSGLTREEALKLTMSDAGEVSGSVLGADTAAATPKRRGVGRRRREGRIRRRSRADLRRRARRPLCKTTPAAVAQEQAETQAPLEVVAPATSPVPETSTEQAEVVLQAESESEAPVETLCTEAAPSPAPVSTPAPASTSSTCDEPEVSTSLLPEVIEPTVASTSSPSSSSSSTSSSSSPSSSPSSTSDQQGAFAASSDSSSSSSSTVAVATDPLDDGASITTGTAGTGASSRESSPAASPSTASPAIQLKEQKRRPDESQAFTSFPEKRARLDEHQSFRNTVDCVHSEKPQPTTEEPKVPPIRIQLSRIKPPWVKGPPTYQICPRIVPPSEGSRRSGTGARTLADIKARAQQARAQREAAAAVAATGDGAGPGGGGPGGGVGIPDCSSGRRSREHPGPVEPGGGGGGGGRVDVEDQESSASSHSSGAQLQPSNVESLEKHQVSTPQIMPSPSSVSSNPSVLPSESPKTLTPSPTETDSPASQDQADICGGEEVMVSSCDKASEQTSDTPVPTPSDPESVGSQQESRVEEADSNESRTVTPSYTITPVSTEAVNLVPTSIPDSLPRFGAQGVDVIRTLAASSQSWEGEQYLGEHRSGTTGVIQHGSDVKIPKETFITARNGFVGGVEDHVVRERLLQEHKSVETETEGKYASSLSCLPNDMREEDGVHSDSTETASDFENETPEDDTVDWHRTMDHNGVQGQNTKSQTQPVIQTPNRLTSCTLSSPQHQQPVIQAHVSNPAHSQTVIQARFPNGMPNQAVIHTQKHRSVHNHGINHVQDQNATSLTQVHVQSYLMHVEKDQSKSHGPNDGSGGKSFIPTEDEAKPFCRLPTDDSGFKNSATLSAVKRIQGTARPVSSVEANNPLVTQLLQGSLPLEKVLPQSHSASKLEINRLPGAQAGLPANCQPGGSPRNMTARFRAPTETGGTTELAGLDLQHRAPSTHQSPVPGRNYGPSPPATSQSRMACMLDEPSSRGTVVQQFVPQQSGSVVPPGAVPVITSLPSTFSSSSRHSVDMNSQSAQNLESAVIKEHHIPQPSRGDTPEKQAAGLQVHSINLSQPIFRTTPGAPSPPHGDLCPSEVVPTVKISWRPSKSQPLQPQSYQQQLSHGASVKHEVSSRPSCQQALTKNSQASIGGNSSVVVPKKEPQSSTDNYTGSGGAMEGLLNMEMSFARMAKKEQGKNIYTRHTDSSVSPVSSSSATSASSFSYHLYGKLPKLQQSGGGGSLSGDTGGGSSSGFSYTANVSVVDGSGFSRSIADSVLQLRPRVSVGNAGSQSTALSIQAFAESAAEEVALKCSCRLKAMIMCQGCGAFCHDDCIGPSKLCVSCLVVR
ncbi:putative Polycomb group protein ASXL1 isoform X3 [Tachysurus fulvidraco]|uniref:putative Polycomb group protein ASXL1 isoform X3 n=1 Tax=Tachysurus fulvidraco TaxID=1234273 RepID=UPI001FEF71AA|nr:putative Polycomb group protein ASXL1 isoform X3 [Tachysurus fulvidraco]